MVQALAPGSPADRAGLAVGDRVREANGHAVRTRLDWQAVGTNLRINQPVHLVIERDAREYPIALVLPRASWRYWATAPGGTLLAARSVQIITLALALLVVVQRPRNPAARVGAWALATVSVYSLVWPSQIAALWRELPAPVGAALVAAMVMGRRRGYPQTPMKPSNLVLTMVGAGMLWVGWFGFNAGSELAADGVAGMAMLVTQVATAAAALTWMFLEWTSHGKPSALGLVSGAVAGLVAITPASGFVGPMGSLVIGIASGACCYFAVVKAKRAFGYDDSLDAFGVHGVGGIVGALLTGVFIDAGLGGAGLDEGVTMVGQLIKQFVGVGVTIVYCGVVSFIILKVVDAIVGLRVTEEQEQEGLDLVLHDEQGYNLT
jgi:hypothetical protein